MDKLTGKAKKIFNAGYFPKFLATVDGEGVPNIVPVLTLKAADETTLIFARFMVWKTARNLESTRKLVVSCIGPGLSVWSLKGEFVEFVKHGPYLKEFNETFLFRYNAYAGVNEVGVIRVVGVMPPRPVGCRVEDGHSGRLWADAAAGGGAVQEEGNFEIYLTY
jgi:hypothetical protein